MCRMVTLVYTYCLYPSDFSRGFYQQTIEEGPALDLHNVFGIQKFKVRRKY